VDRPDHHIAEVGLVHERLGLGGLSDPELDRVLALWES